MAPVTGPLTAQKSKERTGCGGKRCGRVRIRKSRLCELLRAVGGGVTRATAAQRLRPRPTCGEITRHHSLANASENSCVTPSVIDSNSPGRPFSLPRHMAPAEWRKPGMPGIGMGKFSTWQNSANQRSTTLATNTVTNTDPCHGTGLKPVPKTMWQRRKWSSRSQSLSDDRYGSSNGTPEKGAVSARSA